MSDNPATEKVSKPKPNTFDDVDANCMTEEYDDHGGGAFCVDICGNSIYSAKEVRRFIKWLERAEKWIARKEEYR